MAGDSNASVISPSGPVNGVTGTITPSSSSVSAGPIWVIGSDLPATQALEAVVKKPQRVIRASVADRVRTRAVVGDEIEIIYGMEPAGGNIVRAKIWEDGKYWIVIVWCQGEVADIHRVYNNGVDVTLKGTHYRGTASQSGDPDIEEVFGQADALRNVCYSVYGLDESMSLEFVGIIKGHLLWDPRISQKVWSANSVLQLAHYISQYSDYGVNWDTVPAAADRADEELGDGPRWESHLTLNSPVDHDTNIAAMKEYAGVHLYIENGLAHFVPSAPRPVDHILLPGQFKRLTTPLKGPDIDDVPTKVSGEYTAYRQGEYVDDVEVVGDDEPGALRHARLVMPGIRRAGVMRRKCLEVYNHANLARFKTYLDMFDYGLKVAPGDRIQLTSAIGLVEDDVLVLDAYPTDAGRHRVVVENYNELMFSDEEVVEPVGGSNPQPNPLVVPLVEDLALTEDPYQMQDGTWATRIRATWSAANFPFWHEYEVVITDGTDELSRYPTTDPVAVFGPLVAGVTYTIKVRIRGLYATGDFAQSSLLAEGKTQRPGAPSFTNVFEAGGKVFFKWIHGYDPLDWRGEEIRWGEQGASWDDMQELLRSISAQEETNVVPVGTWDFEIRTYDSVRTEAEPRGQYSLTGDRWTITVDDDADAFHIDPPVITYDAAESSGLIELDGTYVTDGGDSWDDMFGSSPMSNFTDPVNHYVTDTASKWVSEEHDMGQELTVTVQLAASVYAPLGDVDISIETRTGTTGPWTSHAGSSIKTTLRQFRVVYETTATERMAVPPPYGTVSLNVIPISRKISFTTDGVGLVTETLPFDFTVFTNITVSAPGVDNRAVWEDLTPGSPSTVKLGILDGSTHVVETGFCEVFGY